MLLSLTSMALVGTADLLLRRATLRGVRPGSFVVLQSWFFGPTAFTWALAAGSLRGIGAPSALLILGQFSSLTIIAFCWATWREGGVRFTRAIWTHAPVCGVLNSSGHVLLAWALTSGEASAAVPVSQMSVVFTFLLAAPLFGEPVTPRKLGGLVAAVLAVLAFSR